MPNSATTTALLDCVSAGDAAAETDLFGRHRDRIRRMVAIRMDRNLQRRFDPSDVVQDALAEALDYAHHPDVILRDAAGKALVADFGLAPP